MPLSKQTRGKLSASRLRLTDNFPLGNFPQTSSPWTSTHMDKFLGGQLPPGQVPDVTTSLRTSSWWTSTHMDILGRKLPTFWEYMSVGVISLARNLSGGKLSPQDLVHMGTCPGGSCPPRNLSGGKFSPQEFVHGYGGKLSSHAIYQVIFLAGTRVGHCISSAL